MQLADFKSRWQRLFVDFKIETTLTNPVFSEIVKLYSRNDRYYHNLLHIQRVLDVTNTLKSLAINFHAIEIAAWFHDVIYDPQANDNEEKSAKFASDSLISLNVPQTTIDRVVSLILQTKNHHASLENIDSQILLDADLSILGVEGLDYMAYARSIRQEYCWLSEAEYRAGRKRVLQDFLERDRIYFTEKGFQMFELKARENIIAELSTL
jgi:predicted metal-dependent HD superfamily phosphohydrolase